MSTGVRAGDLEHKATLKRPTGGVSASGQPLKNSFTTLGTVHADVNPSRGSEKFEAGREMATEYYRFTIRYWAGLQPKDVINVLNRDFDIQYIEPLGRHNREWMMLHCEVRESAGPLQGV